MIDMFGVLTYMMNRIEDCDVKTCKTFKLGTAAQFNILKEQAKSDLFGEPHLVNCSYLFQDLVEWLNKGTGWYHFKPVTRWSLANDQGVGYIFDVYCQDESVRIATTLSMQSIDTISVEICPRFDVSMYKVYLTLASKLCNLCSDWVRVYIRDMYDVFMLLHIYDIEYDLLRDTIEFDCYRAVTAETNMLVPDNYKMLRRASDWWCDLKSKPDFKRVFDVVSGFLATYVNEGQRLGRWDCEKLTWTSDGTQDTECVCDRSLDTLLS